MTRFAIAGHVDGPAEVERVLVFIDPITIPVAPWARPSPQPGVW